MICEVCGLDKAARAQDVFGYTVCDDCAVIIHDKFLAGLHDMVKPPKPPKADAEPKPAPKDPPK